MAIHETKKLKATGNPTYITWFDGLADMAEVAAEGIKRQPGAWGEFYSYSFVGRRFFNIHAAAKATGELWPEGMQIFDKMLGELETQDLPKPKSTKRRGVWSEDTGDEVDVDRLRRGVPYWRTTQREQRAGNPIITLITTPSSPGLMKWQNILWRGCATVVLAKILEEAGYRCEIKAMQLAIDSYGNNYDYAAATTLKMANDPLDCSTLVNCLSGWCFRTVWFSCYNYHNRASISYGLPITGSKAIKAYAELCPELAEDGSNYLMVGDHSNTSSYETTLERTKALLTKFIENHGR